MEDFVWEVEENERPRAEYVEEKEYYTKEEVDRIIMHYYCAIRDGVNEKLKEAAYDFSYLSQRVERLEDTLKEAEDVIGRYLDKEKEIRRKAAIERLNSDFYNIEDDEEEEVVEE